MRSIPPRQRSTLARRIAAGLPVYAAAKGSNLPAEDVADLFAEPEFRELIGAWADIFDMAPQARTARLQRLAHMALEQRMQTDCGRTAAFVMRETSRRRDECREGKGRSEREPLLRLRRPGRKMEGGNGKEHRHQEEGKRDLHLFAARRCPPDDERREPRQAPVQESEDERRREKRRVESLDRRKSRRTLEQAHPEIQDAHETANQDRGRARPSEALPLRVGLSERGGCAHRRSEVLIEFSERGFRDPRARWGSCGRCQS